MFALEDGTFAHLLYTKLTIHDFETLAVKSTTFCIDTFQWIFMRDGKLHVIDKCGNVDEINSIHIAKQDVFLTQKGLVTKSIRRNLLEIFDIDRYHYMKFDPKLSKYNISTCGQLLIKCLQNVCSVYDLQEKLLFEMKYGYTITDARRWKNRIILATSDRIWCDGELISSNVNYGFGIIKDHLVWSELFMIRKFDLRPTLKMKRGEDTSFYFI